MPSKMSDEEKWIVIRYVHKYDEVWTFRCIYWVCQACVLAPVAAHYFGIAYVTLSGMVIGIVVPWFIFKAQRELRKIRQEHDEVTK